MQSLVDQIKTANQGIKNAATTGGDALNQALTFALNGDAPNAATWINNAITAFAPILSESAQPPARPVTK